MSDAVPVTPYDELNVVLAHLVRGARSILEHDFIGAYLQGSFAIGDYSEYSDCDFVIVVAQDLRKAQLLGLQDLHQEIQRLPCSYWHKNLEGSYMPQNILRRWSLQPRDPPGEPRDAQWRDPGMDGVPPRCYPFWYLNHGADTLVRSEHDNSQVVRWTLREQGVCISGPPLTSLIDPVSADALRDEVRNTLDLAIGTGLAMPGFVYQAFWVGLCCRILHTIATGRITSKKEALRWARDTLDAQWHGLIDSALTLRKGDQSQALAPVAAEVQQVTCAFADHCRDLADTHAAGDWP